ncbi:MAG: TolC family protein [Longimicrobiaceae bacterium]
MPIGVGGSSGGRAGSRVLRWARRASVLAGCLGARPASAQQPPPGPGLTLEEVVRSALAASADVQLARWDLRARQGALQAARGAFDPELRASVAAVSQRAPFLDDGGIGGISRSTTVQYGFGLDRRFRSGVSVLPQVAFTRVDGPGAAGLVSNEGAAGVDVAVPLLRGRGGGTFRAGERAAGRGVRAAEAELRHARAGSVLRAVLAYWDFVAAHGRLEMLRRAEARTARLVEDTRRLVEADERPAVDLIPVRASLASRRASRIAGEQALSEARREVALAMGTPAAGLAAVAPPATGFPDADTAALVPTPEAAAAEALLRRGDVAAALGRREAAAERLRGARGELRPRLDLEAGVGYRGLEAGGDPGRLVSPFYSRLGGARATLGVTAGIPLRNRAARGEALQAEAALRQAEIVEGELARAVALEAATAAETLARAAEERVLAAEAVRLHEASVEAETQKFRLGTATLFDVIFAEDALTSAQLAEIDARRRHAAALARLRYETGALAEGETGEAVDVEALVRGRAPALPPRSPPE